MSEVDSNESFWHFEYGNQLTLSNSQRLAIPVIFTTPFLVYELVSNLNIEQIGTLIHTEFLGAIGFTSHSRYPAYRGKNLLYIDSGFSEQFWLSFSPVSLRSTLLDLSIKIWIPSMSLSRAAISSGSTVTASTTSTPYTVASDVASKTILAANNDRLGATIWNASTAILYLDLDSAPDAVASANKYTVALQPGDYYECPYRYTGKVVGVWAAQNGSALVRELT